MKKKIVAMCATVAIAALAVSGTLAYFTDTDDAANTMTMGSVAIVQNEQERAADGSLQGFTQAKPLLPAVFEGAYIDWAPEADWVVAGDVAWRVVEDNSNVVDKFVTVTNTGKSAAYVRTLIAFEGDAVYGPLGSWIHINVNSNNVDPAISMEWLADPVQINGVAYTVFEFVYPEALASGATSDPSLKQVYMNKGVTNEIVEVYGDNYDILVLSQAAQADGWAEGTTAAQALDTAFGELDAASAKAWFEAI